MDEEIKITVTVTEGSLFKKTPTTKCTKASKPYKRWEFTIDTQRISGTKQESELQNRIDVYLAYIIKILSREKSR